MFSPLRCIFWVSTAAIGLAAAPAHAAAMDGFLTEVQGYASEASWAIAVYAKAMAAGDMPHIRATSFVFSGLVGLIGLWLLAVRPHSQFVAFDEAMPEEHAPEPEAEAESEADRPTRLLEAIAAAKAQMSISEAEKKHSR
jgi:Na+-transporting methylmalonyl-CoA/oxaloacetate decarboxylase gamma subunit